MIHKYRTTKVSLKLSDNHCCKCYNCSQRIISRSHSRNHSPDSASSSYWLVGARVVYIALHKAIFVGLVHLSININITLSKLVPVFPLLIEKVISTERRKKEYLSINYTCDKSWENENVNYCNQSFPLTWNTMNYTTYKSVFSSRKTTRIDSQWRNWSTKKEKIFLRPSFDKSCKKIKV